MPGTITAAQPSTKASLRLTDAQIGSLVQALDTNHDGQLTSDEVRFSFAARGRMTGEGATTAAVTSALRDERVAIRQLPAAIANQVALVLAPQLYGLQGLPRTLDTDKNGTLSAAELTIALNKGQLVLNRSLRASAGAATQEEHYATSATLPVAQIAQALEQSQYHLIRGNAPAALQATVGGLMAVAAAGGSTGLAANAIYQGISAMSNLPTYAAQPGWLAMVGRFGLAAMSHGDTNVESLLASAARQVLYERPDEDGVRAFFTGALQSLQAQQAKDDDRWDSTLLAQLETEPSALALMRSVMAGALHEAVPGNN
jgi:hypothetical protein